MGPKLEGLDAYFTRDHWHFVTVGLTDLRETSDPEADASGLGYELTMRVRDAGKGPADWAIRLLAAVGDLALAGEQFGPGHTLDVGEAFADGTGPLTAVGFVTDPSVASTASSNGSVSFLQVVSLTADQGTRVMAGELALEGLAGKDGLYITDATDRA